MRVARDQIFPVRSEQCRVPQTHLSSIGRADERVSAAECNATVLLAAKGHGLLLWRSGPALLECRGLVIDGIRPVVASDSDSAGFQTALSLLLDRIALEAVG
jgi:hypothetical protein